jgi:mono/diheme cytochrome c family protein
LNLNFMKWLQHAALAGCTLLGSGAIASAQDKAAIEAGEQVYEENCAECHGEKLRSSGAVPDLRNLPANARALFNEIVKNGRGQMPAWEGQLTDENFDQIWAYIRSRAQ